MPDRQSQLPLGGAGVAVATTVLVDGTIGVVVNVRSVPAGFSIGVGVEVGVEASVAANLAVGAAVAGIVFCGGAPQLAGPFQVFVPKRQIFLPRHLAPDGITSLGQATRQVDVKQPITTSDVDMVAAMAPVRDRVRVGNGFGVVEAGAPLPQATISIAIRSRTIPKRAFFFPKRTSFCSLAYLR